jgi:hypothetical protein
VDPPREATQVRIFTAPNLGEHLVIASGEYVDSATVSAGAYDPVPIMIGEGVARITGAIRW